MTKDKESQIPAFFRCEVIGSRHQVLRIFHYADKRVDFCRVLLKVEVLELFRFVVLESLGILRL